MYLDAVDRAAEYCVPVITSNGAEGHEPPFEKWKDWLPAPILHHEHTCCELAREWLKVIDFSEMNGAVPLTGPRWLSRRFQWGPCEHPLYWCEAVRSKVLDCSALAALAHETFIVRGLNSYRVQLVQRYSRSSTAQWVGKWTSFGSTGQWIDNDLIYHEGCATVTGPVEIKIWDASAGWWIDPRPSRGYGSLAALRLVNPITSNPVTWGPHQITPNQWLQVGEI